MKHLILMTVTGLSLAACASPEASLQHGKDRCDLIGYDIARERVPTLQCIERGYDIHQQRWNGETMIAGATVAAGVVPIMMVK